MGCRVQQEHLPLPHISTDHVCASLMRLAGKKRPVPVAKFLQLVSCSEFESNISTFQYNILFACLK